MADEHTHADSARWFLTGAASHAGVQTDPNASLGLHQSSTEVIPLSWDVTSPVNDITIELVSSENGIGAGTLTASGASELKWTPPGGTLGSGVTIANGETKVIEGGGGEPEKFIRVTRTAATALSGTATVTTAESYNNVFGFADVSAAQQAAGVVQYRCVCIENVSANEVQAITVQLNTLGTQATTDVTQLGAGGAGTVETTDSFADWPESGHAQIKDNGGTQTEVIYYESRTATVLTVPAAGRGIRSSAGSPAGAADDTINAIPSVDIAIDAPTSQPSGTFEDETGDDEVSPGFTFATPVGDADAISIGALSAGYIYGIWLERTVIAGATAEASVLNDILLKFNSA